MSGNGGTVQEVDTRSRLPGVIAGMEKTLERELGRTPTLVSEQASEAKRNSGYISQSPLQIIADALKRLVWDDNEKLAQIVGSHMQLPEEHTARMAAAIQRAADDLKKEDPGSRQ